MDKDEFLKAIAKIETSGGRNIQSVPSTSGMTSGRYQLTQQAIKNLPKQLKNQNIEPSISTDLMSKMSEQEYMDTLREHQPIDQAIAEDYLKLIRAKAPDDALRQAYMWNQGPNADKVDTAEMIKRADPGYIKKFIDARTLASPDQNILDPSKFEKLRKSLRR